MRSFPAHFAIRPSRQLSSQASHGTLSNGLRILPGISWLQGLPS